MLLFACSCEMKIQSQVHQVEEPELKVIKMVSLVGSKSEGK